MAQFVLWIVFTLSILFVLALDLGVLNRKAHTISLREAALWSVGWITLAMLFAVGIFIHKGKSSGIEFLTGYVIELSLSIDNVFLFAVLFANFQIPAQYQHRVLSWGIFSAIVLRGIMIVTGAKLLENFHWILYVFGGMLIMGGIRMFLGRNKKTDTVESRLVHWLQKRIPLTEKYDGQKFITVADGRRVATPLFLTLLLVEVTDVMFALDSIPAIFAITGDRFIVFTSNIFAILGLRSLYFLLAGVMDRFHYLKVGLSAILVFVGVKMLAEIWHIKIDSLLSLGIVVSLIALSVLASLWKAKASPEAPKKLSNI